MPLCHIILVQQNEKKSGLEEILHLPFAFCVVEAAFGFFGGSTSGCELVEGFGWLGISTGAGSPDEYLKYESNHEYQAWTMDFL
jgi:hypothetical protein